MFRFTEQILEEKQYLRLRYYDTGRQHLSAGEGISAVEEPAKITTDVLRQAEPLIAYGLRRALRDGASPAAALRQVLAEYFGKVSDDQRLLFMAAAAPIARREMLEAAWWRCEFLGVAVCVLMLKDWYADKAVSDYAVTLMVDLYVFAELRTEEVVEALRLQQIDKTERAVRSELSRAVKLIRNHLR